MIDLQKQIDYWINEAEDNILSADILIQKDRFLHGLFFCHLVIDKAIKAHVVKESEELAPRSHNLILLSEKAKIENEISITGQISGLQSDYSR